MRRGERDDGHIRRQVGRARGGKADGDVTKSHGISIKLSALYPRYEHAKRERVLADLVDGRDPGIPVPAGGFASVNTNRRYDQNRNRVPSAVPIRFLATSRTTSRRLGVMPPAVESHQLA